MDDVPPVAPNKASRGNHSSAGGGRCSQSIGANNCTSRDSRACQGNSRDWSDGERRFYQLRE